MNPEELAHNRLIQSRAINQSKQQQRQKQQDNAQHPTIYAGFDAGTGQPLTRSLGGDIVTSGKIITNGNLSTGDEVKRRGNTFDGVSRVTQPQAEVVADTETAIASILFTVQEEREEPLSCTAPTWRWNNLSRKCEQKCDGTGAYSTLDACIAAQSPDYLINSGTLSPGITYGSVEVTLNSASVNISFSGTQSQVGNIISSTVLSRIDANLPVTIDISFNTIAPNPSPTNARRALYSFGSNGAIPLIEGTTANWDLPLPPQTYSASVTINSSSFLSVGNGAIAYFVAQFETPQNSSGIEYGGTFTVDITINNATIRDIEEVKPSKITNIFYLGNTKTTKLLELTSDDPYNAYLSKPKTDRVTIKAGKLASDEWARLNLFNATDSETVDNPDPPTINQDDWQKDWAHSYSEVDPSSSDACANAYKNNESNLAKNTAIQCDLEQEVSGTQLKEKLKTDNVTAKFTVAKISRNGSSCNIGVAKTKKIKLKKLTRLSNEVAIDPSKTEVLAISVYYKES